MIFTIYLITNKLNGKVYVGQTNQLLCRRWGLHKSRSRRNTVYTAHLYNAINKYGIENFEIREIATCESEDWSNYLECLYILLHDSTNPSVGYNMTTGGERPKHTPESIEKQRQKILGTKHPPEFGARQSELLKEAWASGRHTGTRGKKMPLSHGLAAASRTGLKHHNFIKEICAEEFVFLRNNGVLIKDIAHHFGVSAETVNRRMKATQLPVLNRNQEDGKYVHPVRNGSHFYKPLDEELLTKLFEENLSLREIGRRLGRSHGTISDRVKALGLTRIR